MKTSLSNPNSNSLKSGTHAHIRRRLDVVITLKLLTLSGTWPLQLLIKFSNPWHQHVVVLL